MEQKAKFKTFQEAFDATIAHLAKQGKQAKVGNTCTYLSEEGDCCAVGAHIPRDHPSMGKFGKPFVGSYFSLIAHYEDLRQMFRIFEPGLEIPHLDFRVGAVVGAINEITTWEKVSVLFWKLMQTAHDESYTLEDLKTRLERIAAEFKLDTKSINQIDKWENA